MLESYLCHCSVKENLKMYIEEGQTIQCQRLKRTNNDQQNGHRKLKLEQNQPH